MSCSRVSDATPDRTRGFNHTSCVGLRMNIDDKP